MLIDITAEAERDLLDIALHIARDNRAAAEAFLRKLRAACDGLAEFPERFALVPRYETLGVRHRVVGNYLIFYRVESGRVVVLHVRHGASDYADLLEIKRK